MTTLSSLIAKVTAHIHGRPLDGSLETSLNETFPPDGTDYLALYETCRAAIDAGWMCSRGSGDVKYGRVIKPGPSTHGFSVDVVDMQPVAGPHHSHPNGEIDLVMPIDATALFDGRAAGWLVYGPASAHHPTVSGGRALVLYLLPDGAIEFTKG
jgi:hypothetical protein